jgi:hypothetical protein
MYPGNWTAYLGTSNYMTGSSALNFCTFCTSYTDAQYFMISEFKHRNVNVYKKSNVKIHSFLTRHHLTQTCFARFRRRYIFYVVIFSTWPADLVSKSKEIGIVHVRQKKYTVPCRFKRWGRPVLWLTLLPIRFFAIDSLLLSTEHNANCFSYIFIFTLKEVSHTKVCSTLLRDLNAKIDIQHSFPSTKQT